MQAPTDAGAPYSNLGAHVLSKDSLIGSGLKLAEDGLAVFV